MTTRSVAGAVPFHVDLHPYDDLTKLLSGIMYVTTKRPSAPRGKGADHPGNIDSTAKLWLLLVPPSRGLSQYLWPLGIVPKRMTAGVAA